MMLKKTRKALRAVALLSVICAHGWAANQLRVAVLGVNALSAWNQDVQHKLMSTGSFGVVDTFQILSTDSIPSLSTLQNYDAVLVYSVPPFTSFADQLGNQLADYIDGGGGVVDLVYSNDQSSPIAGRFRNGGYALLAPGFTQSGQELTLGNVETLPSIFAGVPTFDGGPSSFFTNGVAAAGSDVVASWINGVPLVILGTTRGHRRVTLNFFPVSNDIRSDLWDAHTDPNGPSTPSGAFLMANSLVFVSTVTPPPPTCSFAVSPTSIPAPASASSGNIQVTASSQDCHWTASAPDAWARLSVGDSGNSGSGIIIYSLDANAGTARTSVFQIAGQTVTVSQAGSVLGFSLSVSTTITAFSHAFSGAVDLIAPSSTASWTARSNVPWITITAGLAGTGNGNVAFSADANFGPRRMGTLTIAGLTYTVVQGAGSCYFTLQSTTASVEPVGGDGTAVITASAAACPWTATSNASWLTVTSPTTGIGNESVSFTAAPNPSANPRIGTLTVALQTFTVTQPGATSAVPAQGSSVKVAVLAATANPAWNQDVQDKLTETGLFGTVDVFDVQSLGDVPGGLQSYDAILAFTGFDPINVADRFGDALANYIDMGVGVVDMAFANGPTTPIGGRFRAGGYALTTPGAIGSGTHLFLGAFATASPIMKRVRGFDDGISSFFTAVTLAPGTDVPVFLGGGFDIPLAITGAPFGHKRVTLNFFPVSSDARPDFWNAQTDFVRTPDGALLMGNALVSVVNNPPPTAACSFTLSPPAMTVPATGLAGLITVTASDPRCFWNADSTDPWARIPEGDAQGTTGSNEVGFTVDANTGPARTTRFNIAGQNFVLQQAAGNTPGFSLDPAGATLLSPQSFSGRVTVTAQSQNLSWTATSNAPWITITSGSSGTGNGTVFFTVAPNAGPQRNAVLTIAGLTLPVSQAGVNCFFHLGSNSTSAAAFGGVAPVTFTSSSPGCPWTAASNAPWLTVSSLAGTGSSTVNLTLAPNPSASSRTGTAVVAGQTFTVNQAGTPAMVSLNPPTANFPPAGGPGSVALTVTPSDVMWNVSSNVTWIVLMSPASGQGNATVSYSVAANTSPLPRTGTLTIAGVAFPVTQAGARRLAGSRFVPVAPCRLVDTRNAPGPFGAPRLGTNSTRTFDLLNAGCGVPATSDAYSLNITVVPRGPLPFLTIWPAGQPQPPVSTLNSLDGRIVANSAIVPGGANGAVTIFSAGDTDVIVDIDGYFDGQSTSAFPFFTITPCRLADTRGAVGPFGAPSLGANQARGFSPHTSACALPDSAQAYALNATVMPLEPLNFLTLWPAGQVQPLVSTLNSLDGQIVANGAIVAAGAAGAINALATNRTDLILDATGFFGTVGTGPALSFFPVTPCRIADTRNAAGQFGGPEINPGGTRTFAVLQSSCGVPAAAAAYALNITAIPLGPLQFLSAWPANQPRPTVSTLNSLNGAIVANAAIVPAAPDGSINVFVSDASNVILDITGYFAPASIQP